MASFIEQTDSAKIEEKQYYTAVWKKQKNPRKKEVLIVEAYQEVIEDWVAGHEGGAAVKPVGQDVAIALNMCILGPPLVGFDTQGDYICKKWRCCLCVAKVDVSWLL